MDVYLPACVTISSAEACSWAWGSKQKWQWKVWVKLLWEVGPAVVITADNNKHVLKRKHGFLLCSSSKLLSRNTCTFSSLSTFSIFVISRLLFYHRPSLSTSLCVFPKSLFQTHLPCLPRHPPPLWFSPTSPCESSPTGSLWGCVWAVSNPCLFPAATASIQKGGGGRSWKQQGICTAMLHYCWGRADTISTPSSGDNSCDHMAKGWDKSGSIIPTWNLSVATHRATLIPLRQVHPPGYKCPFGQGSGAVVQGLGRWWNHLVAPSEICCTPGSVSCFWEWKVSSSSWGVNPPLPVMIHDPLGMCQVFERVK